MTNRTRLFVTVLFLTVSLYGANRSDASIVPPIARIIPRVDTVHGDILVDNYYWLRDRDNPEVIEYLKAENTYTEAMMQHTESLQETLYGEMQSRIRETDLSVPVRRDDYFYYSRTEEGKQYRIYCRKKGSLDRPEQVLLDLNRIALAHSYVDLGAYEVSPDHRLLAYSIDTTGSERYVLYIKDLIDNTLLDESVVNAGRQVAWANDNRTVFYTALDDTKRPYKLLRHELGTDPSEDPVLYHETDEAFWLDISKTKSEQYVIMESGSHTTTEIHYLDADEPLSDFRVMLPREPGIAYYMGHRGDRFYIMINKDAVNFKLMETSVHNTAWENWSTVIAHRDSVMIDTIDVFENHIVIYEREAGLRNIRIMDMVKNEDYRVDFPEASYAFWPGENPEYKTEMLRFEYMSLVTPRTVFDFNMNTRTRELKKQYEVLGVFDPGSYQVERIEARAEDGTMIPISLVYRKEIARDGNDPLLLMGYGAYGWSYDPYFSSNRLSLLDRGFIYAIAHVRGGSEMGKHWHEQAQFLNKQNTFNDFIACIEYLIEEKYTSPERLVISGGSAGGLLVGAVTNMRPELFAGVVAEVPFVDVVNTLLDLSIPLTAVEHTELGDPREERFYYYMRSYSPYDNVRAQEYPNMLITAGLNDPRVGYWEPAKWTAKLRALKTDDNLLLLRTNMGAGHEGASGRYDYLKELAFEYAFILDILGMSDLKMHD